MNSINKKVWSWDDHKAKKKKKFVCATRPGEIFRMEHPAADNFRICIFFALSKNNRKYNHNEYVSLVFFFQWTASSTTINFTWLKRSLPIHLNFSMVIYTISTLPNVDNFENISQKKGKSGRPGELFFSHPRGANKLIFFIGLISPFLIL